MTTTCVRDSMVGDQWIYQTAQAVPIQAVLGDDGQPTGDYLTGPVRLAFDNLFDLPQATATMQNPKYGATLLYTPYADFQPLYDEYFAYCAREFADHYDAQSGNYYGLNSPFRDQAEKVKFGGFTPGCIFMTCTSKYKPPVVDLRGNPIVDKSKVYPGVWAICGISAYAFKDQRKKGVGFGLQSVKIIGDDTKFGGGAPDTGKMFAATGGITAPITRPDLTRMPQGQQPAGALGGRPAGAPIPQQRFTPPAGLPGRAVPQPAMPAQDDDDWSFMN